MSAGIQVKGLKELEDKLEALIELAGKPNRVLNAAGRRAWKPTLEAAKAALLAQGAYRTGDLYNALMITTKKPRAGDGATVVHISGLKIRKGTTLGSGEVDPRRRWHLVEFGVPNHGVAPRSYLRAPMATNQLQMVDGFAQELRKGVDRALKRGRAGIQGVL